MPPPELCKKDPHLPILPHATCTAVDALRCCASVGADVLASHRSRGSADTPLCAVYCAAAVRRGSALAVAACERTAALVWRDDMQPGHHHHCRQWECVSEHWYLRSHPHTPLQRCLHCSALCAWLAMCAGGRPHAPDPAEAHVSSYVCFLCCMVPRRPVI